MMLRRKSLGYKAMQLLKEIVPEETKATKAKKKNTNLECSHTAKVCF